MFMVNNFDEDDSSFSHVRAAIQKLSGSNDYKVQLPASWLGLELALRSFDDNVISITECERIAKEYSSIDSREKLDEALWFLHSKVGSIRYYKQIPELRNVVIIKPQVLFTVVTDLLVGTFPFDGGKAKAKFRDKGCFGRDEVNEVGNIRETGLSVTQVIALLCYLHILAPLKVDHRGNREYFLPCALSHAPKLDQTQLQSKGNVAAPQLLISFKCGYTPKGVFSGLISYMIQNTVGQTWILAKDCIFRDQATFLIDDTGYCLTITNLTKFLSLEIRAPQSIEQNFNPQSYKIFKSVISSIEQGLVVVAKRLNYQCDTDPLFGFYCRYLSCVNDESHPACLQARSGILICSKHASHTAHLTQEEQKWFPDTLTSRSFRVINKIKGIAKATIKSTLKKIGFFYFFMFSPLFMLWVNYQGKVNFDTRQLKENSYYVEHIQQQYYNLVCYHNTLNTRLSCKLESMFRKNYNSNIQPIRLAVEIQNYDFEDLTAHCHGFVIQVSFDNCHPKPCQYPMREIQNGFIQYLNRCPSTLAGEELCWPIAHHLIGFSFQFVGETEVLKTQMKFDFDAIMKNYFNFVLYYYYYMRYNGLFPLNYNAYYYPNMCINDVMNAIDTEKGLTMEDLLTIMKFIAYTKPELAPVLILKNIDKAFPVNGSNEAIDEILYHISRETSSIRWVTPIVATASDMNWFRQTKHNGTLLKDYFPIYKKLK